LEEDKECYAPFIEWVCRFARLSDCLKQKQNFVVVSKSLQLRVLEVLQITKRMDKQAQGGSSLAEPKTSHN
jgi:hypothetical protein